eukprot:667099-Amphidinium_carterae.1
MNRGMMRSVRWESHARYLQSHMGFVNRLAQPFLPMRKQSRICYSMCIYVYTGVPHHLSKQEIDRLEGQSKDVEYEAGCNDEAASIAIRSA